MEHLESLHELHSRSKERTSLKLPFLELAQEAERGIFSHVVGATPFHLIEGGAAAQWQKVWAGYSHDHQKLRTLGISLRTAIACVLASCFVVVPPLYRSFPSGVQGMLCNAVVMVTFAVGDTLGETISWCVSGTMGVLCAFTNYRAMLLLLGLLPSSIALQQMLIVVEFFLFTFFVNASGASYMGRQMAMGYYAFYGLCLLNPGCNVTDAQAADLWTTVGAAVSILVMLFPPCTSAVARVYSNSDGTLARIARANARAMTLTSTVFLAVEEQALLAGRGGSGPAAARSGGRLPASVLLIQESLDMLGQVLGDLEMDLSVFWWEAAMASTEVLRRFLRTMRTVEAYLLMQRQGVLFSFRGKDRESCEAAVSCCLDPSGLVKLREELGTINVKLVRLTRMVRKLVESHHAAVISRGPWARGNDADKETVREAKQVVRELADVLAWTRLHMAQRNLANLPDLGAGRVLVVLSVFGQCSEIMEFTMWLCDNIEKDRGSKAKEDLWTRPRALTLAAWTRLRRGWSWRSMVGAVDFRGKAWASSVKAAVALTFSFVMSAWLFDYDSMSVSATAYILGAYEQDSRCLGGTIWKALCRVIGVMVGGVVPGVIHNYFVPPSGSALDCPAMGHVVNCFCTFVWCFCGLHLYKLNRMVTTQFGHFGYVGLMAAFVSAQQFLSGCQTQVPISNFILQTVGGSMVLLLIECTFWPKPASCSIQSHICSILDRQVDLLTGFHSLQSGEQWASETQWLTRAMALARSEVDQALTEDTFKLGHVFFLFMPSGYSCKPFRQILCTEILSLVQQMHLNVLFLLFAKKVGSAPNTSTAETADAAYASGEQTVHADKSEGAEGNAPASTGARSPLRWRESLSDDMLGMIAMLKDAVNDLKSLIMHELLNDWQARDLSVEAAAGLLLQQGAEAGGQDSSIGHESMRGIFQSVLEHVDPWLSDADVGQHWEAFEQVLNEQHSERVSPAFFQKAISPLLHQMSGRPSLNLERLDTLLQHASRFRLQHQRVSVAANNLELCALRGSEDLSDTSVQQTALELCHRMALVDTVLLLAFTAGQLCNHLGHFCSTEPGDSAKKAACLSQ